tara:strand:+ start:353 stop:1513 length:1161 start_codon:yes stop_codon:yes gene_type:complete
MAIQSFTLGQILTAAQMNALQGNDYNQTVSTKTANYVLVAADKGTRVAMNAVGSTSITVNTSVFSAGDTVWIQNIGAGTCTITAGTATVGTASSLALAQYGGGTLYFTSASAAIFFSQQAATYGTATGLTGALATPPAGYSGLYATSDGTLTVTRAGLFDVLMFGGGASGGYGLDTGSTGASGGGGAGGMVTATVFLAATTYAVTIGAGGSASSTLLGNGLKTSLGAVLVSAGGGVGYGNQNGERYQANPGGAGGGAGRLQTVGGVGIQGFNGGANTGGTLTAAGGGGGVSAIGVAGATTVGGAGGAGFDIATFTGNASTFKGGGGGGGASVTAGAGGSSVGGAGSTGATGSNAAANTASGGGGAYGAPGTGGSGGSGIFYIRFKV